MTKEEREEIQQVVDEVIEAAEKKVPTDKDVNEAEEIGDKVGMYHDLIGRLFCELNKDDDKDMNVEVNIFSAACIKCAHTMLSTHVTDKCGSKSKTAKAIMMMIMEVIPD